jgi:hypothetical protein
MRLIYLDTSMWNVLCDQAPNATEVRKQLEANHAQIVLGLNAYFEMLRTPYGKNANISRGKNLFELLSQFFDTGLRVIRTWEEMLVQESRNVLEGTFGVDPFCERSFSDELVSRAKKLASGVRYPGTEDLVRRRDAQSARVASLAEQEIVDQAELRAELRSLMPAELPDFIERRSRGSEGQSLLAKYLPQVFSDCRCEQPIAADELAAKLLQSPTNRTAHATVRSGIYQIWRVTHNQDKTEKTPRVRRDVPDDLYHVANASYCHVFVTENRDGQAEAARYALPGCQILLYGDRKAPFFDWLCKNLADADKNTVEEQVEVGRKLMAEYQDTFRALAKS